MWITSEKNFWPGAPPSCPNRALKNVNFCIFFAPSHFFPNFRNNLVNHEISKNLVLSLISICKSVGTTMATLLARLRSLGRLGRPRRLSGYSRCSRATFIWHLSFLDEKSGFSRIFRKSSKINISNNRKNQEWFSCKNYYSWWNNNCEWEWIERFSLISYMVLVSVW